MKKLLVLALMGACVAYAGNDDYHTNLGKAIADVITYNETFPTCVQNAYNYAKNNNLNTDDTVSACAAAYINNLDEKISNLKQVTNEFDQKKYRKKSKGKKDHK